MDSQEQKRESPINGDDDQDSPIEVKDIDPPPRSSRRIENGVPSQPVLQLDALNLQYRHREQSELYYPLYCQFLRHPLLTNFYWPPPRQ